MCPSILTPIPKKDRVNGERGGVRSVSHGEIRVTDSGTSINIRISHITNIIQILALPQSIVKKRSERPTQRMTRNVKRDFSLRIGREVHLLLQFCAFRADGSAHDLKVSPDGGVKREGDVPREERNANRDGTRRGKGSRRIPGEQHRGDMPEHRISQT
jgi:hypothetical protein